MTIENILKIAETNEESSKEMAKANSMPCLEELCAFFKGQAAAYGHIAKYIKENFEISPLSRPRA